MSSDNLPAISGTSDLALSLSPLAAYRNQKAVVKHTRQAVLQYQLEQIDVRTATEAAAMQLEAEMALYHFGMQRAGDDPALQYLVAMKLAAFAETNRINLVWKFR